MSVDSGKILVIDDEPDIRNLIKEILEDENYEVATANGAAQADEILRTFHPHLILLDIWMPDMDGISLLKQWQESNKIDASVIMISGHGTVETAIEATRLGAYDFIEKPLSLAKLTLTVKNALENTELRRENTQLREHARNNETLIGKSGVIKNLKARILQIVEHSAPLLIVGESGTNKELVARYLHSHSSRAERAFISAGISTFSADNALIEFFGGEDNDKNSKGLFQQAEGGTLFLKDIAHMSSVLQAKLQQTLEKRYFTRIGGHHPLPFDIRIVTATNHDMLSLVKKKRFRDDLYYQLNILHIEIPPLRDHPEDIPELLEFYANFFADREGLPYRHFTVAAQNYLRSYAWPGNLRELKNLVQRLLILRDGKDIELRELDILPEPVASPADSPGFTPNIELPLRQAREQFEKYYLRRHLDMNNGNVGAMAKKIGMERTHLYRKLRTLGIKTKQRTDT